MGVNFVKRIVSEILREKKSVFTPFSKMATGGQEWRPHKLDIKLLLTLPTYPKNKIASSKKFKARVTFQWTIQGPIKLIPRFSKEFFARANKFWPTLKILFPPSNGHASSYSAPRTFIPWEFTTQKHTDINLWLKLAFVFIKMWDWAQLLYTGNRTPVTEEACISPISAQLRQQLPANLTPHSTLANKT